MQIFSISPLFQSNRIEGINLNFQGKNITKPIQKVLEKDTVQLAAKSYVDHEAIANRNKKILEMLKQGFKYREIAEKFNIGLTTISKISTENNACKDAREARKKEAVARLMRGERRADIAKALGISKQTVDSIAEEYGTYVKYRASRDEKILSLLKEGYLAIEVADKLGISPETVSRVAHKNGIRLQKKRSILK